VTVQVKRILVGVDGSANARRALDWTLLMGRAFDAEIIAIHAVGLLSHLGGPDPVVTHSHLAQLREAFEHDWCAPLAAAGGPVRMLLRDGPPVAVILGAALQERADLIVLGSRGEGGFDELLLGSTSHQVAQHTDRPVLIVPPAGAPGIEAG